MFLRDRSPELRILATPASLHAPRGGTTSGQGRLDALRSELAALEVSSRGRLLPLLGEAARPETSAEKVALFRHLFRGRDDLYPKLWTNTTTGRRGYAV